MGGAKQGYPVVSRMLAAPQAAPAPTPAALLARLNDELRATVHEVDRA